MIICWAVSCVALSKWARGSWFHLPCCNLSGLGLWAFFDQYQQAVSLLRLSLVPLGNVLGLHKKVEFACIWAAFVGYLKLNQFASNWINLLKKYQWLTIRLLGLHKIAITTTTGRCHSNMPFAHKMVMPAGPCCTQAAGCSKACHFKSDAQKLACSEHE